MSMALENERQSQMHTYGEVSAQDAQPNKNEIREARWGRGGTYRGRSTGSEHERCVIVLPPNSPKKKNMASSSLVSPAAPPPSVYISTLVGSPPLVHSTTTATQQQQQPRLLQIPSVSTPARSRLFSPPPPPPVPVAPQPPAPASLPRTTTATQNYVQPPHHQQRRVEYSRRHHASASSSPSMIPVLSPTEKLEQGLYCLSVVLFFLLHVSHPMYRAHAVCHFWKHKSCERTSHSRC